MMELITRDAGSSFLEWRFAPGKTVEIVDIVVHTDRRKGVGRSMVNELKAYLKQTSPDIKLVYAITRRSNRIARQFYQALGFRFLGRLDRFYPIAQEDAVVVGLDL